MSFLLFCLSIVSLFSSRAHGDLTSTDYSEYNDGKLGHCPVLKFYSSEEFSPLMQVNIWNKSATAETGSHIFLRHDGGYSSSLSSPLILDTQDLSAVYMNRTFEHVFNTRVQENFGKKYLTFWEGRETDGFGDGYGLAFDDTYHLVYKIWAQNIALHSDLHEFEFTGHGTALVTGIDKVFADASSWKDWSGPSRYWVLDALFQEIDLETNKVLFSWRALDHLSPMDSFEPQGVNWDAFHLNSIQKTDAGNYLISLRHFHSIMLVDGKTSDIIWTLGGKRNDFVELLPAESVDTIAPLLSMAWQHHARYVPETNETEMTFFDNHVKVTTHGQCQSDCSRGLHIAIDDMSSPRTVRLLREYLHPTHLQAQSQGSVQPLSPQRGDTGNVFVGWGRCPAFTEHTASGETVLSVQFSPWHSDDIPDALDNYRAFKMDWSATPWWDPAVALRRNARGEKILYVSWNGATEVRSWDVRGSDDDGLLDRGDMLATSARTGFETRLTLGKSLPRYLWAEALDQQGNVLRSSAILDMDALNITIVSDADETDLTHLARTKHANVSTLIWAISGAGIGALVLATAVIAVLWLRRRKYNRLAADDDLDQDMGMDLDLELETELDAGSQFGLEEVRSDARLEMLEDHHRYADETSPAGYDEVPTSEMLMDTFP